MSRKPGDPEASTMKLVVEHGPGQGHEVALERFPFEIGRGPEVQLNLADPSVSRLHAVIRQRGERLVIENASKYGTRLNGQRIDSQGEDREPAENPSTLRANDRLTLGDVRLRVLGVVSETDETRPPEREGRPAPARRAAPCSPEIVAESQAMKDILAKLTRWAGANFPILLLGPPGVGKEVLARFVHDQSGRPGAYQIFDCTKRNEELFDSELFGHVEGAFTNAKKDRRGLALEADKGTLFLDELGELPFELQPRLLRFLENGEVKRLGENQRHKVDVRIVAATNRDLDEMVRQREFRDDLLGRVRAGVVRIPPLAGRPEDVRAMALQFLGAIDRTLEFGPGVLDFLAHVPHWSGNVRQLKYVLVCAAAAAEDEVVTLAHVEASMDPIPGSSCAPATTPSESASGPSTPRLPLTMEEAKIQAIRAALEHFNWNQTAAARHLGINRRTIAQWVERLERGDDVCRSGGRVRDE